MNSTSTSNADPRMQGLSTPTIARMHAAARAIRDGAFADAHRLLTEVLTQSPDHAEALRLTGLLLARQRRPVEALATMERAAALHPNDALLLNDLGTMRMACGQREAAFDSWRRACVLAPEQSLPWFNLGRNLQQLGDSHAAAEALQHAVNRAPDLLPAHIMLGDALAHLGRFDEAEAHYRQALRIHPACGDAWRGLSNIKTHPLSEADGTMLHALLSQHQINATDRIAMGYALGKFEEDHARYPQAFAALSTANGLLRRRAPWSGAALLGYVDAALAATRTLPAPVNPTLGQEVIFIVGLPRSGSTLYEQILATHPHVEGASELPDLGQLIQEESVRRNQAYPQWIDSADASDWLRLGQDYLQRTARWRTQHPRFVDKMPENWKHVGLLRAMLPGATVLDVRRDAVETGWSCFRQQFYQLPHFSCDLTDIAIYTRACQRALDAWRLRDPRHIHLHRYEALLADPERSIRALLDDCGLPFDPICLQFHRTERSVRTASAAQVRQPLRGDTARAHHYGALLDPLRRGLQET